MSMMSMMAKMTVMCSMFLAALTLLAALMTMMSVLTILSMMATMTMLMCDLYEDLKTMISVVANLQPMTFSAIEVGNFVHLTIQHGLAAPTRTF
jgi:hypothetical protein